MFVDIELLFRTVPRSERFPTPALENGVALLLGANVLLTAFGSSSVMVLADIGRLLRWVDLAVLALLAAPLAIRTRHGRPGPLTTAVGAAAAALCLLAIVSTGYSIEPRLTLERALSLTLALATAALLAYAAEVRPGLARRILVGIVGGGIVVVAAGLVVYVFDRAAAVQPTSPGVPVRWRGIGENPNTVSLLAAVDLAGALWLTTASVRIRRVWASGAVGLALTILASGSRGALLAGVAGALVIAATLPPRVSRRLALAAVTLVVAGVGATVVDHVAPSGNLAAATVTTTLPSSGATTVTTSSPSSGAGSSSAAARSPTARSFTSVGSSGRIDAWWRAFHLGNGRPALGYGFGMEEAVFVPRFREFSGRRPENSFLGLYLQLGLVGVLALVAVLVATAIAVLYGLRRRVPEAPALAGMLVSGALFLLVQSYVYAIGNVAAMTFWTTAMLAAALTRSQK